jgi:hypothetical protein
MPAVAADPERHRNFIFAAWCQGAGEPREVLHRLLRTQEAKAFVWEIEGEREPLFAGFVVVDARDPQRIVWAYTKQVARKQGVMTALLDAAGTNTAHPLVAPENIVSRAIQRRGWPITFESNHAA